VESGRQPHQLHRPWGAESRGNEAWQSGRGPAVSRCSSYPEGLNLPIVCAGHSLFCAALDTSRFSWRWAVAGRQKHMAVGGDVALAIFNLALRINSLEANGILAGLHRL